MMPELARFRKYARKMRNLRDRRALRSLFLEAYSVLQLCAINGPLFPNLRKLELHSVITEFIPFVSLFLSPRITAIVITFAQSISHKVMVTSIFATLPTLCPNLQEISLCKLPRDSMVIAAVSRMLLASNRNALRTLHVDSPLTEEAREMICRLPNLRHLTVVIERGTSLPLLVLPSLTSLNIEYDSDSGWSKGFRGAILGKLETISFDARSEQIGDFLGEFERVALTTSIQDTLSTFNFNTLRSWRPNYRSLLPFTQLANLIVEFNCSYGCSSTVDDDLIATLARAMPKLETLELGDPPCDETPTGVTVKGLVILAHHCLDLSTLRVHFQVASLSAPPTITGVASDAVSTALRRGCALTDLNVGEVHVPEESVLMVSLTLALIFPRVARVNSLDDDKWEKVIDAILLSRQIVDCSSRDHPLPTSRSDLTDPSPGGAQVDGGS